VSAQYSNETITGREHYLNINIFHRRAVSSFLCSERKVILWNQKLINMFTKAATGPYPAAAPYVLAYSPRDLISLQNKQGCVIDDSLLGHSPLRGGKREREALRK
jgi:hypothetical protein